MKIIFYKNNSDEKTVSKNLDELFYLEGTLKEECNVMSPSIIVETENFINANYCFIPEFSRYYFVKNIDSIRNGFWRVNMVVDVLMSFKDEIRNQTAIIDKQESQLNSNEFINDGSFVTESKEYIEILNFTNGFNDTGEFVLITAGGIENANS